MPTHSRTPKWVHRFFLSRSHLTQHSFWPLYIYCGIVFAFSSHLLPVSNISPEFHVLGLGLAFFWHFFGVSMKSIQNSTVLWLAAFITSTLDISLKTNLPGISHKRPGHTSKYILSTHLHLCRQNHIQSSLVKAMKQTHVWPELCTYGTGRHLYPTASQIRWKIKQH